MTRSMRWNDVPDEDLVKAGVELEKRQRQRSKDKPVGIFLAAISKADKHFPKNDMLVIIRDDDMSQERWDDLWDQINGLLDFGYEIYLLEHGTPGHHRKVNFTRK